MTGTHCRIVLEDDMKEALPKNPNPLKTTTFPWQLPQPFLHIQQIPLETDEQVTELENMFQHDPIKMCPMCPMCS